MPIVLRHNHDHEVSRVEYSGALTAADLQAHAQFNAENPVWLGFDCLSIAMADVDPRGLALSDLDAVFNGYRELFQPLNLLIMRRSGWLCEALSARPLLQHWLSTRKENPHTWSEVRLFDSADDAADWLLLTQSGRDALKTCQGFTEIARFGPPTPSRGLAR